MKSVAEWRQWFAAAENDTRTRQEIEDANLGTFPSAPYKTPLRRTNLGFAGDLLPVDVAAGVTVEQLEDPGQRYRLAGPNGMTCAEMLSDEYVRDDDFKVNDEVETDEQGFSVLGISARGRGTYDSNVIGDPDLRRNDIKAQFAKDGGITYRVRRERDGAVGVFRGSGIVYEGVVNRPGGIYLPAGTVFDRAFVPEKPKPEITRYFAYAHLPEGLQQVSRPFGELAEMLVRDLPPSAELSVALRKLLEAKDAAVRASLPQA